MSAMLNVGQRESPNPMSMKSTTPVGRVDAVDQIAERAAAHERKRQRAHDIARRGSRVYKRPRITSATIVSTMKIQREYVPDVQPERRARVVDQREAAATRRRRRAASAAAPVESTASAFVQKSTVATTTSTGQNSAASYFFASSSRCLQSMQ